jgi:hypothetical protein
MMPTTFGSPYIVRPKDVKKSLQSADLAFLLDNTLIHPVSISMHAVNTAENNNSYYMPTCGSWEKAAEKHPETGATKMKGKIPHEQYC